MVSRAVKRVNDDINWDSRPNVPETSMWDVKALVLDPANARKHSEDNILAIKTSLQQFGQQIPIVVTSEGVVKKGNGTVLAAKEVGWSQIWCYVTDLDDLQADDFAVADNRSAELAFWDDEILSEKLTEMQISNQELFDALGFTDEDVLSPDLTDLDVDVGELGIDDKDFLAEAMVVFQIQISQHDDKMALVQQEIGAICEKYGLFLESRVQIK